MLHNQKIKAFAGIDNEAAGILAVLRGGPMRPIEIARESHIGRTTVNYILKQLQARGIISRITVGKHYEWTMIDNRKLNTLIDQLYGFYRVTSATEIISMPEKIGVEVLLGKEGLKLAYRIVLQAQHGERIYQIQGARATHSAIIMGEKFLKQAQEEMKQRGIVLEGILGKSALAYTATLPKYLLEDYASRLVVAYVVDDSLINFNIDILLYKKQVIIIDFTKELAIIIKNEQIRDAIFCLYESLKQLSRKIDLNNYFQQVIDKKK